MVPSENIEHTFSAMTELEEKLSKKEYNHRYREAHRAELNVKKRQNYHANPEKDIARVKTWQANHPGYVARWKHATGRCVPMSENKECASYLGIYVTERALSKFFDHIERMPYSNPGFDYICGRGFKIDVKSACLQVSNGIPGRVWGFRIKHNKVADYFLCVAFDNRESLAPQHIWLIPGKIVNDHIGIYIANNPKSLARWSKYEQPLERVVSCCDKIRSEVV